MSRRLLVSFTALALAVSALAASPVAAASPGFEKDWALLIDGWNRSSSPVIADIDGDDQNEIVFGHQDGTLRAYEGDGTLKWSTAAVHAWRAASSCPVSARVAPYE